MRSEFLLQKIYREHPALLRWVYVPVCSPARVSRQPGGMAGETRLVPWDHGAGMCSLGGGRMGVLCSKAREMEKKWKWKEHGLPSGQKANHKENRFKTRPQASTHSWEAWSISQQSHHGVWRFKKGAFLQNRASFLFQVYLLNKCRFQSAHSLAHVVTGGCSNQRENLPIWQMELKLSLS